MMSRYHLSGIDSLYDHGCWPGILPASSASLAPKVQESTLQQLWWTRLLKQTVLTKFRPLWEVTQELSHMQQLQYKSVGTSV